MHGAGKDSPAEGQSGLGLEGTLPGSPAGGSEELTGVIEGISNSGPSSRCHGAHETGEFFFFFLT